MTPEQFTYWLNGFAELTSDTPPTAAQWKSICEHLATVFNKVTPPFKTAPANRETISEINKRLFRELHPTGWPGYRPDGLPNQLPQPYFLKPEESGYPIITC